MPLRDQDSFICILKKPRFPAVIYTKSLLLYVLPLYNFIYFYIYVSYKNVKFIYYIYKRRLLTFICIFYICIFALYAFQ